MAKKPDAKEPGQEAPGTGEPMTEVAAGEELSAEGTGEALLPADEQSRAYCAVPNCGRWAVTSGRCEHHKEKTP